MAFVDTWQPTVLSPTKGHALYLWIVLKDTADLKSVVETCQGLQQLADEETKGSQTNIVAGVAFGKKFCDKLGFMTSEDFTYKERSSKGGKLPKSEGDVFVHAKSDDRGHLLTLCRKFVDSLKDKNISSFEDLYGFVYKDSRDLSGFTDGLGNPQDPTSRKEAAINTKTGGSYMITQVWHHKFDMIDKTSDAISGTHTHTILEDWIGRTRTNGEELKEKSLKSHIARMRGNTNYKSQGPYKIVRQGQPIGSISGKDAGLFLLAYAASIANFDFMLDGMFHDQDSRKEVHDDLFLMSENVKGTYWYCPSVKELGAM